MKNRNSVRFNRTSLLGSVLWLLPALPLTMVGVTRWPILLYGAAPFYFAACLFFFSARFGSRPEPVQRQILEAGQWF